MRGYYAGVILIVYVIIAGLLIPLKPGIESVEPSYGNAGETLKIQVTGYNTHFKEAGNTLRAWLKWDNGKAIAATEMVALDERRMNLTFSIPLKTLNWLACAISSENIQSWSKFSIPIFLSASL